MRAALAVLLLTAIVLSGCSGKSDQDGDGLYSSMERKGWTVTVDYLTEHVEYHTDSSSKHVDTDGDGIPDGEEYSFSMDARKADSDEDGLTDCQEVRHTNRTQCEDSSFTGPFDGGYGTDALRADSDPGVGDYVLKQMGFVDRTDSGYVPQYGDGITDGEEIFGYTVELPYGGSRFVTTDPRNADTDEDGLDDGEERFQFGTDPQGNPDSDGDGCRDGEDVLPALDERFRPGFGNFTLKRAMDSDGGADLFITILVGEARFDVPQSGTIQVMQDTPVPLPEPAGKRQPSCAYSPRAPWLLVQLIVSDDDAPAIQLLDVSSATPAASAGAVNLYWNAQTGAMSWTSEGAAPARTPLVLEGQDGVLELHPQAESR